MNTESSMHVALIKEVLTRYHDFTCLSLDQRGRLQSAKKLNELCQWLDGVEGIVEQAHQSLDYANLVADTLIEQVKEKEIWKPVQRFNAVYPPTPTGDVFVIEYEGNRVSIRKQGDVLPVLSIEFPEEVAMCKRVGVLSSQQDENSTPN